MVRWPRAREGIREHNWDLYPHGKSSDVDGICRQGYPGKVVAPGGCSFFFIFQFATAGYRCTFGPPGPAQAQKGPYCLNFGSARPV
jgi:hypothetical protein